NGLTQSLIGLLLSLNSPLFLMTELGRSYDFLFPFTHLFLHTHGKSFPSIGKGLQSVRKIVPIDWKETPSVRKIVPIDWKETPSVRKIVPIDWKGASSVRKIVPIGWKGATKR
ncbi:MAG: hypothetical protein WC209_06310, partial [Ignavibacteriaceae bacterium]